MGMSIREKARIAWEDTREVVVIGTSGAHYRGRVMDRTEKGFTLDREMGTCPFSYSGIKNIRFVDEGEEDSTTGTRTVCKETLDFLRGQVKWNADERHIKTKYVYNLIDDLEKALASNKVRMNWPFLEECVQDGANREMDEEDKPSPPEPEAERWEVVCSKGHYRIESTLGKRIALSDCIPLETAIAMAGAVQMRDALRVVTVKSNFQRITKGGHDADRISVEFNPDQWRVITDALEKAGG